MFIMHYKRLLTLIDGVSSYLSVGLDVGADFTWMSIALPNGSFTGKPFKIVHSDPGSRDLAVAKIKEAQETYSLKSRCFLESTGIYHIPLLCFLRDKGFDCSVINPIITKNSTNINIRKLQDTLIYGQICLLQSLRGIGFLSAVVLIAEMGNFKLFSSPKKLYAYFGLDPAVKQSGKLNGDKVHMSKRGSSLARRVLHMAALNNVKVDKGSGTPVNPVVYDYYTRKCSGKKKPVAMGAVMHKICNIIFAMLRDNKPFEILTPEEHCRRFAAEHPDKIRKAA